MKLFSFIFSILPIYIRSVFSWNRWNRLLNHNISSQFDLNQSKKKFATSDVNLNSSVCCKLGQTFLTYYMIMKNNIEVTLFACSYLPFVCSNPHLSLFKITYWMTKRSLFSTFFLTKIVANATQSKELLGTYRAIRLYWSKTGNIVSFIKLIFKKNC